ncbi:MAG TPA: sodium:solute symporter family protein [Gemmatimonadales bacterium]|jgi:Na+/proline symporter
MQLSMLDWLVVVLYGVVSLTIGLAFARRAGKGIQEFFLSGRQLPWWLLGTSMVATTFSTDTPNLVTDLVRSGGVRQNWIWWAFLLTGMCTVFFYAKLWRRSQVLTDIGFYELRYAGWRAAFLRGFRALYLGVFFNVIIMASVTLAAIKISGVLLGVDKYTTVVVAAGVTMVYAASSGLWGVVVTDFLQFAIAIFGAFAAAYYALGHPAVGGLDGLLAHPAVADKLAFLPDFTDWRTALMVFVIPIAVQWWSTWYPGAEPGGGGYIAQRMLAARDERHAMKATLWFNIAHYALRPWPWIVVALASIIVYPDLATIAARFPHLDPRIVRHDLGYPAMLVFLPHGLLGLVVASLAAAYMSTISTHLNWGASYVVDDVYKRFLAPDRDDRHYVALARLVTVVLVALSAVVSLWLENAVQAFQIMLQIGAGTGLIFLLRWFWWRINAWSEISAMAISFSVALWFQFGHVQVGLAALDPAVQLVVGVAITTLGWFSVTLLTAPTPTATLQAFYDRIRPFAFGWRRAVTTRPDNDSFTAALACWFLGCGVVYATLFGTGFALYGRMGIAALLLAVAAGAAYGLFKTLPRVRFE